MSTSVDMTAVLAKLDELYDGRGEDDPLTDYATYDSALRAVLAIHRDNGHGWCQGCGWNTDYAGWTTRMVECRTRAAVAAALGVTR